MAKIKVSETVKSNLDLVYDLLGGVGVESFIVAFSGGGDDGQIEGVTEIKPESKKVLAGAKALLGDPCCGAKISDGQRWHPNGVTETLWKNDPTLEEMIESVCYESLENAHGGWEINEGSDGTFHFDVKKRKMTLDFNEHEVISNNFQYEL